MLVGIDEVGRGALAGPVMVGACATPPVEPFFWGMVRDSKKVNESLRGWLFDQMDKCGVAMAVGAATQAEIDEIGIERATILAAKRALKALENAHPELGPMTGWEVLVDGDDGWGIGTPIVKGDDKVKEIGAASIAAKVVRDLWMSVQDPDDRYGFAKHKGYGTKQHMDALKRYGPSYLHRMSFRPCAEASQNAPRSDSGPETPDASMESRRVQ